MPCYFFQNASLKSPKQSVIPKLTISSTLQSFWPTLLFVQFNFWVGKIHRRKTRLPTPVFLGFLCGSSGKESACNVRDLGLIPGLGRSPREGKGGYPLQDPGLDNSHSPWGRKESDTTERLSLSHDALGTKDSTRP